jgi:hypothetical protein
VIYQYRFGCLRWVLGVTSPDFIIENGRLQGKTVSRLVALGSPLTLHSDARAICHDAATRRFRTVQVVKSCPKSDSVSIGKASTRSSARKPGYLTFPVVGLRVSVAQPAQPVWNFSPRFRSEFLPLGDARGSYRTAGVAFCTYSRLAGSTG